MSQSVETSVVGIRASRGEPRTMRVLVIEDDTETALFLQKALKESGHGADLAADGETGLSMAGDGGYDVLIVDRMLPRLDGLSVVRSLRSAGNRTPVLILSALGEVDDRVKGLRAGGDDYLTKPYAYSELLARIEALSRRAVPEEQETRYVVGDLVLDRLSDEQDIQVIFSPREENQNQMIVSRKWQVPPVTLTHPVPLIELLREVNHVVTGGGTMLREAAWFGVSGSTVFQGPMPAVDEWLESQGAIRRITPETDLAGIDWAKIKEPGKPVDHHPEALPTVIDRILAAR